VSGKTTKNSCYHGLSNIKNAEDANQNQVTFGE
jgi:hypothetical protein